MNHKMVRSILALVSAFAVVAAARAGSSGPSTFQAHAVVKTNCLFSSSTFATLDFATYDPLVANATAGSGDIAASTTLTVNCTKGTAATLTLDAGANTPAAATPPAGGRYMKNGTTGVTDLLVYTLTKPNAALTADSASAWLPTDTFALPASTGRNVAISVPVYGHLAGGQDVQVGDYTDTVSATVNY